MNYVCVSTHRRPFHTRLCLEAIARAQRWSRGWADKLVCCFSPTGNVDSLVSDQYFATLKLNPDLPFEYWVEPESVRSAHDASKWILDKAFSEGANICVYVEDDAVLSPDVFLECEFTLQRADALSRDGATVIGCCLYHETIPEQYHRENREPDPALLHLSNGINTCGGTAFLREPYLNVFQPNWNCKQVEPRGFDYSLHYLMYLHKFYVIWPDFSRSMNCGFELGSISQPMWAKYFGRSLWVDSSNALRDWRDFRFDGVLPPVVREQWMEGELQHRGLS